MFGSVRHATYVAGLTVIGSTIGLVLAGCGSSGSSSSATTAATPPAATTTAETTETPPTATTSSGPQRISIVFKNDSVVGGLPHVKVKQGDHVVLSVKADVTDEVHLHGYDIKRDVAPGKPATIAFTAKIPGRFEAELESRSLQILDLEVRP
jgi:FtsP/CotA-like multicopper oxidase with cupredoxin domain